MTPKRQKWWDSLPANEKILRENLKAQRILLSVDKEALTNHKGKTSIAKMIRRDKVLNKAIKHELDRTTVVVYTGRYEGAIPIYRCEKCNGMFENFEQSHCCWCGRKIKEWKK